MTMSFSAAIVSGVSSTPWTYTVPQPVLPV
jgi:hypothetical protein